MFQNLSKTPQSFIICDQNLFEELKKRLRSLFDIQVETVSIQIWFEFVQSPLTRAGISRVS